MKLYVKDNHLILNPRTKAPDQRLIRHEDITASLSEDGLRAIFTTGEGKTLCTIETRYTPQGAAIAIDASYRAVFGLGERFDAVNQKGMEKALRS